MHQHNKLCNSSTYFKMHTVKGKDFLIFNSFFLLFICYQNLFFRISESQLLFCFGKRLFYFDSSSFLVANVMHTQNEKHIKPPIKNLTAVPQFKHRAVNIFIFIYYMFIYVYIYIMYIIYYLYNVYYISLCREIYVYRDNMHR